MTQSNTLAAPARWPAAPARARQPVSKAPQLVPPRLPASRLLIGPALLVLVWEAASRLGFLSPATLTAPSQALVTAWQMWPTAACCRICWPRPAVPTAGCCWA